MSGALTQGGAYQVPHTRLESLCVYTNQVPGGYMRASGELQTVFATETHMDRIAAELGIDPLEFRFLNALSEGDGNYSGFQYRDIKCREVLERARAAWTQPKLSPLKPGNSVGRGMALSCRHVGQSKPSPAQTNSIRLVVRLSTRSQSYVMQKQVVAEISGSSLACQRQVRTRSCAVSMASRTRRDPCRRETASPAGAD
jgi:CO/xanthine dehydrogenase Mo-binding subunit